MLYIVRGLPGSGKSTFAHSKRFAGALVLENDMYHIRDGVYVYQKENMPDAINWCMTACRYALLHHMDCVVSNTFTKCLYIRQYADLANYMNTQYKVFKCVGHWNNVHNVPSPVLDAMNKQWEDWQGEEVVDFDLT